MMKAGIASLLGSLVGMSIVLAGPSLAQTNSYSTATTTSPADNSSVASDQPGKPATTNTGTATTENSSTSWQQSASEAAHNAEVATEKAYNHVARDLKDISLQSRIEAVLHENKWTRDSEVHVTADNGIVTLKGQAASARSAQRVEQVVADVYGVKAVNNELNYPRGEGPVTPRDADSMGVAHPAYSDTAPAENAPAH
jgi:osmotically-inducible protein OsmY